MREFGDWCNKYEADNLEFVCDRLELESVEMFDPKNPVHAQALEEQEQSAFNAYLSPSTERRET
jgi:hypothetical protein